MKTLIKTLTVTIGVSMLASCASNQITYKDPGAMDGKIVSIGKINQQDWGLAASRMTDTLIQSGRLVRTDGKDSVVAISTIANKTNEHIDTDLLIKKIRVGILRSGQAMVTTAVSVGGPEDAATMRTRKELRNHEEFNQKNVAKKGTMAAPSFSLSGKIIESSASAGKTNQSTFTFQLSMTDMTNGLAVWEDEFEIVKQGKGKASVGY